MTGPGPRLDGAGVVRFARIDGRVRPTGGCRHRVAGSLVGPASGLAIGRYEGESSCYLFDCDPDWNVLTDTWHATAEDAMAQAEFEYAGVAATWEPAD
jgi:hypothetical protein